MFTHFNRCPNRCWSGVEDGNAVFFNYVPRTTGVGGTGNTFVHQRRRAVGKRTINYVAMTSNPTYISCAPIYIGILNVKNPFGCDVGVEIVTTCCMHHAFRLAGGSGCVEDEQHILTVHRLGWAIRQHICLHLMPPAIASRLHDNLLSGAPDNQDVLHAGYTIASQGDVNLLLEGYNRILAPAAISGDDNLGLGVYEAVF